MYLWATVEDQIAIRAAKTITGIILEVDTALAVSAEILAFGLAFGG